MRHSRVLKIKAFGTLFAAQGHAVIFSGYKPMKMK